MTDSDPYKPPEQSEFDTTPATAPRARTFDGPVSLALTLVTASTLVFPLTGNSNPSLVVMSITYALALFTAYRAFLYGGVVNRLFAVLAVVFQLWILHSVLYMRW